MQELVELVTGQRYLNSAKYWASNEPFDKEWYAGRQLAALAMVAESVDLDVARGVWPKARALVDGRTVGALEPSESVRMTFAGAHGQNATLTFTAGQAPAGVVVLDPDVYRVSISTYTGDSAPSVLNGQVVYDAFDPRTVAGTARLNLETVAVSGQVRIDGADVPAATSGGYVHFIDAHGGFPGRARCRPACCCPTANGASPTR